MEHPSKLMALSSQTSKNGYDRLSDLPECLIHHIISFLGPNDIVSLSSLSSRLRLVCLSCPYLCLSSKRHTYRTYSRPTSSYSSMSPSVTSTRMSSGGSDTDTDSYSSPRIERACECTEKCRKFSCFVDRFLNLHDGNEIYRFSLNWSCQELVQSHKSSLDGWISIATRCNLHELDLNLGLRLYSDNTFGLHRCLLTCKTLRVLKLQLSDGLISLPPETFSSLENLLLERVKISNVALGVWVSKYCTGLKKLTLKDVNGIENLIINSSSLEELSIYKAYYDDLCHLKVSTKKLKILCLDLEFSNGADSSIEIYAPCLQSLIRRGTSVKYIYQGSFRSLQNATIDLVYPNSCYGDPNPSHHLENFLQSVRWARVLHLNSWVIQAIFKPSHLPILFENLRHLVLELSQSDYCELPFITSFLEGLVGLNSLTIKYAWNRYYLWDSEFDDLSTPYDYGAEFEDSGSSVVSQLKEVEIELPSWKFVIRLVKYLLKHANRLEKMTICFPSSCFRTLSCLNLQNFDRASSSVSVFVMAKDFEEEEE